MKKLLLGLLAAGAFLVPTAAEAHSAYHYHEHHHHSRPRYPHGGRKDFCHYHRSGRTRHCHSRGEGYHPWRHRHSHRGHRTGVYFWFGN